MKKKIALTASLAFAACTATSLLAYSGINGDNRLSGAVQYQTITWDGDSGLTLEEGSNVISGTTDLGNPFSVYCNKNTTDQPVKVCQDGYLYQRSNNRVLLRSNNSHYDTDYDIPVWTNGKDGYSRLTNLSPFRSLKRVKIDYSLTWTSETGNPTVDFGFATLDSDGTGGGNTIISKTTLDCNPWANEYYFKFEPSFYNNDNLTYDVNHYFDFKITSIKFEYVCA
ncbi:MAG: hypothetical protein LKE31_04110 [Bacilli bacterium]|jgi:hypothetical protein|nr:hypothetical protein [Bacilli bacterium]MCH4278051.1 hypothetical protein [Bacilli bacterium]